MTKRSVAFLCTHNSARSQMAEGLLREKYGDRFAVYSAGTEATEVKEYAVRVLAERGIDAGSHRSKTIDAIPADEMDIVVTVCDSAREACPYLPGRIATIHHAFSDPSDEGEDEAGRLAAFRRVRDEIADWIDATFGPGGRFGT